MPKRVNGRATRSGATVRIVRYGDTATAGGKLVITSDASPAPAAVEFATEQLTVTTAVWLDADGMPIATVDAMNGTVVVHDGSFAARCGIVADAPVRLVAYFPRGDRHPGSGL